MNPKISAENDDVNVSIVNNISKMAGARVIEVMKQLNIPLCGGQADNRSRLIVYCKKWAKEQKKKLEDNKGTKPIVKIEKVKQKQTSENLMKSKPRRRKKVISNDNQGYANKRRKTVGSK